MPKPWAGLLWAQSWWLETREGSMREKRGLSTSCSRHSKHGPAGHHAPSPRRHSNGQATVVSREPPMLALWSQPRVLGGSRTLTSLSHQYTSSPFSGCTEHLSQVQHWLLRETKPLLKPLELQPRQRMKSSPHKPHKPHQTWYEEGAGRRNEEKSKTDGDTSAGRELGASTQAAAPAQGTLGPRAR